MPKPKPIPHAVHFASKSDSWVTPKAFFDKLNDIYGFTVDAACTTENKMCTRGFTWPERNGLAETWAGERVWVNPPYGRALGLWTRKASLEAKHAALIVMLVPSRTDTVWWHEAIKTARPVFLKGRLRFEGAKSSAPFPSALLIWNA